MVMGMTSHLHPEAQLATGAMTSAPRVWTTSRKRASRCSRTKTIHSESGQTAAPSVAVVAIEDVEATMDPWLDTLNSPHINRMDNIPATLAFRLGNLDLTAHRLTRTISVIHS
jgi:hypothetical protein